MIENINESMYVVRPSQKSDDSYFYSNTDYTFEVVGINDNRVVKTYHGSWYQNANSDDRSGVKEVTLIGQSHVRIEHFDGTIVEEDVPTIFKATATCQAWYHAIKYEMKDIWKKHLEAFEDYLNVDSNFSNPCKLLAKYYTNSGLNF
jgi:hypothetical protein